MPTPTEPRLGKPGKAGPPAPPSLKLLDDEDLDDPERFVKISNVPVLDAHDHPEKGLVSPELLQLIAENTNRRAASGNYPLLLFGHTKDDAPEHHQPIPAGVTRHYRVGDYRGRPCLYADLHVRKRYADTVGSYPHRSVERLKSDTHPELNQIDSIALLRIPAERDLGVLTYSHDIPEGAALVRYARDLGGLPVAAAAADPPPTPGPALAPAAPGPVRAARADLMGRLARYARSGEEPAVDDADIARLARALITRYSRPQDCGKGKGGRFEVGNICASRARTAAQAESHVRTRTLVESVRARTGGKRPARAEPFRLGGDTGQVAHFKGRDAAARKLMDKTNWSARDVARLEKVEGTLDDADLDEELMDALKEWRRIAETPLEFPKPPPTPEQRRAAMSPAERRIDDAQAAHEKARAKLDEAARRFDRATARWSSADPAERQEAESAYRAALDEHRAADREHKLVRFPVHGYTLMDRGEEVTITPEMAGRMYVDNAGNYRMRGEGSTPTNKARGGVVPFNKALKAEFGSKFFDFAVQAMKAAGSAAPAAPAAPSAPAPAGPKRTPRGAKAAAVAGPATPAPAPPAPPPTPKSRGDYATRAAQVAEKARQKSAAISSRGKAMNEELREKERAANRARKPERIAKLKEETDRFYAANKPRADDLVARLGRLAGVAERATKEPGYRRAEARGFTREQADQRKARASLLKTLRSPNDTGYLGDENRARRAKIREALPELAAKVDQSGRRRVGLREERRKAAAERQRAEAAAAHLAVRRRERELRRQDLRESIVDESGRPSVENRVVPDPGRSRRLLEEARARRAESTARRAARQMASARADVEDLMADARYYLDMARHSEGAKREEYLAAHRKARRLALASPFSRGRIAEQEARAAARDIARRPLLAVARHSRTSLSSALSRYLRN